MSKRDWLKHLGFTTATAIVAAKITKMAQSNEPTIEQINEVIALFMGGKPVQHNKKYRYITWPKSHATPVQELNYHKDWSRLMPVWKKAGEILYNIRGDLMDDKYLEAHRITKTFIDACQKVEIESAHSAVHNAVQFIQWYNQQKQKDDTKCATDKQNRNT